MKDSPATQTSAASVGALRLDRILDLQTRLARAPVIGRKRRELVKAIGIAAAAYRMTLDNEQTTATHDSNPLALAGRAVRKSRGPKRSR